MIFIHFCKSQLQILVNMLVKCQAILTWKLTFTDAYRQLSNLPFDTLNLAQWGEFIFEGIISFLCKSNLFKLQNFTATIVTDFFEQYSVIHISAQPSKEMCSKMALREVGV